MRRAASLCSLLLVGCAMPAAPREGFACRSDDDCVGTLGYVCVLAPADDTGRCVAAGSVPGGRRLDRARDAGASPDDGGGLERDSGLPEPRDASSPIDAGEGPRDAGPRDVGGAPGDGGTDDGGEIDEGLDAGLDGGSDGGGLTFPGGYVARVPITVPAGRVSGSEPLLDFPLYVALQLDELRGEPWQGMVRSPDGDDIELRVAGESERLAHELVSYGSLTGEVALFVRVPSLAAASATTLYLYFGSDDVDAPMQQPELVWDDGFRGVWHLDEVVTNGDTVRDSTGQNDGTARNVGTTDSGDAMLARGLGFGSADEAVQITSDDLDLSSTITVEAWARLDFDTFHDFPRIYQKGTGADGRSVEMFVNTNADNFGTLVFRTTYNTNLHSPSYVIPDFQYFEWHHYVGVFDDAADEIRIYLDGALVLSDDQPLDVRTGLSEHWIGNWSASSTNARNWPGLIDEVRVSSVARSGAWIAASYDNQSAPGAFSIVGDVERP